MVTKELDKYTCDCTLLLKNVTVEDAGKYKVTARNDLGESNATITLNFDSKYLKLQKITHAQKSALLLYGSGTTQNISFSLPYSPSSPKRLKTKKGPFFSQDCCNKISQNRILAVPESSRKKIGWGDWGSINP